jgi:hypothetical protein
VATPGSIVAQVVDIWPLSRRLAGKIIYAGSGCEFVINCYDADIRCARAS